MATTQEIVRLHGDKGELVDSVGILEVVDLSENRRRFEIYHNDRQVAEVPSLAIAREYAKRILIHH